MSANTPAQKIEIIQTIFRDVQDNFCEALQLDNYDSEFRSIAYESASMCIALEEFKTGNQLDQWFIFLKKHDQHATQIHVGLGWALAQNEISPIEFLEKLEPDYRYRVCDGYGYYEGFFRRRKSILNQQQPEWNDTAAVGAYNQGLGRSLWYIHNGEINAAKYALEKFPIERHKDLWRGLGIAVAYVGGLTEEMAQQILNEAGERKIDLAEGANRALKSRAQSGCVSADTESVCRLLSPL